MKSTGKILLVEDDLDFSKLVENILNLEGFETITASDCESAFKAIAEETPDLVLLDLSLPDGYSFEVCRRASNGSEKETRIPVIILSGKSSLDAKIKSFMNGATKYFTKPFDVDELMEAVRGFFIGNDIPQTAFV